MDKHHLHTHIVLNSVSFMDGKRYYDNNATYALMRQTSDRLCREYSLSVIENPQKGKSKHYAEWKAEQEGKPTWRGLIREDVDKTIAASMTFTQFIAALRKQGYEVKTGVKYMAVRPPGKERFVRLKTLGDDYTEDAIKQRILQNPRSVRKSCGAKAETLSRQAHLTYKNQQSSRAAGALLPPDAPVQRRDADYGKQQQISELSSAVPLRKEVKLCESVPFRKMKQKFSRIKTDQGKEEKTMNSRVGTADQINMSLKGIEWWPKSPAWFSSPCRPQGQKTRAKSVWRGFAQRQG